MVAVEQFVEEEGMNDKIGVGSVCVIVKATAFPHFVGRECVVVREWNVGNNKWVISVQGESGESGEYGANDDNLKIKKPPSKDNEQERFQEFLTKLTKPISEDEMGRLKSEDNVKDCV